MGKSNIVPSVNFKLRLICGKCGAFSFWPENVVAKANMPTCCGRDLLILGNSKVYIPYISMDHPYMKINFGKARL